jgi:hypothetical protein
VLPEWGKETLVKGVRFLVVRGFGPTRSAIAPEADERAAAIPAEWYSWLLMGGNNRELGRGIVPFASPASCQQAVQALVETELRPVMSSTGGVLLWSWRVDGPAGPVAAGGRTYRRRRECVYAVNSFLDALPLAHQPGPVMRVVKVQWATWRGGDLANVASEPGDGQAVAPDASASVRLLTHGELA